MPIRQTELLEAANRYAAKAVTLSEARVSGLRTAFLCHSHRDRDLARGVATALSEQGIKLYIDWEDSSMPETPNRITAEKIQSKIRTSNLFLFLATDNSMSSRWCPWEIGFANGVKPIDSIALLITEDRYGKHHGNEYMELYRRWDGQVGSLKMYEPASSIAKSIIV